MGKNSLVGVTLGVVVNIVVLILLERIQNGDILRILVLPDEHQLLHLALLDLKYWDGALEEELEVYDIFLVMG
jgi:hypothetical protein